MQPTDPRRAIAILSLSLLCACNAVLGVEDLHATGDAGMQTFPNQAEGGGDGSAGRSGTSLAGSGGSGGGGGINNPAGRGGVGGATSTPVANAGGIGGRNSDMPAGSGAVNAAGNGGAPMPAAGSGGAPAAVGGAIHGRVLDARRRPLPNVSLSVGAISGSSNANGEFSLDAVPAEYDLLLQLSYDNIHGTQGHKTWLFQGLTRRDPTLQVADGLAIHAGNLVADVQNVTFPVAADQRILGAFGSPDGDFAAVISQPMEGFGNEYWDGPASTTGVTHALKIGIDPMTEVPVSFLAHAEKPVSLTQSGDVSVSLDLGGTSLPTGMVSGSVTGAGGRARENWLEVLWNDGTLLPVTFDEAVTSDAFSYLVPTLPNTRIGVIGLAGDANNPPFAVAFLDDAAPGQTGIALNIPTAVALGGPADAKTSVDGSVMFTWTGDDNVYVLTAYAVDSDEALYVVTTKKEAKLPIAPFLSYVPQANTSFEWRVETHGKFASVDEATSEAGLIGSFFEFGLRGAKRGPGTYTESAHRKFTTPP